MYMYNNYTILNTNTITLLQYNTLNYTTTTTMQPRYLWYKQYLC